jgi:hypothetical protein
MRSRLYNGSARRPRSARGRDKQGIPGVPARSRRWRVPAPEPWPAAAEHVQDVRILPRQAGALLRRSRAARFRAAARNRAPRGVRRRALGNAVGADPGQEHLDPEWVLWVGHAARQAAWRSGPADPPAKKCGVERTTFSHDQERAIFASNDLRDRLALHLLPKGGFARGRCRRCNSGTSTMLSDD